MVMHPGEIAAEMTFHAMRLPVIEFGEQCRSGGFGLEPQGVATEIQHGMALVLGEQELVAVSAEGVFAVEFLGESQGVFVVHVAASGVGAQRSGENY